MIEGLVQESKSPASLYCISLVLLMHYCIVYRWRQDPCSFNSYCCSVVQGMSLQDQGFQTTHIRFFISSSSANGFIPSFSVSSMVNQLCVFPFWLQTAAGFRLGWDLRDLHGRFCRIILSDERILIHKSCPKEIVLLTQQFTGRTSCTTDHPKCEARIRLSLAASLPLARILVTVAPTSQD